MDSGIYDVHFFIKPAYNLYVLLFPSSFLMFGKSIIAATLSASLIAATAIPALAQDASSSSSTSSSGSSLSSSAATTSSSAGRTLKPLPRGMNRRNSNNARRNPRGQRSNVRSSAASSVNGVCIAGLVGTRETAIIAAFDAFFASWKTARQTLSSSLQTAWTNNDAAARRTAWETYNASVRSAMQTRKEAVRKAWADFKRGVKDTCKGTSADVAAEATGETADAQPL